MLGNVDFKGLAKRGAMTLSYVRTDIQRLAGCKNQPMVDKMAGFMH
jgi:hypothetical protein